jgi:hypothetical protein
MRIKSYLLLLIIPLILFVAVKSLKFVNGAYYLWLFDQPYAFLTNTFNNSINITQGFENRQGATIQVNGIPAGIVGLSCANLYYLMTSESDSQANDILRRPEEYLSFMNTIFLLLISMLVFVLGIVSFRFSDDLFAALYLQSSLFISSSMYLMLIQVSIEHMLIVVSLLLAIFLQCYYHRGNLNQKSFTFGHLAVSILAGVGIASKLNFFPLFFVPFFIIKGYKNKLLYFVFTSLTFMIFTLPLLIQNSAVFKWIFNLFLHSGNYGTGQANVLDPDSFTKNLTLIIHNEMYLITALLIALIALVVSSIRSRQLQSDKVLKLKRILLGTTVAFVIHVLVVAKHYSPIYLIPSVAISNTAIYFSTLLLYENLKNSIRFKVNLALVVLLVTCALVSFNEYLHRREIIVWNNKESVKTEEFVMNNYPNDLKMLAYSSSNPETALSYMTVYNRGEIKEALNHVLKNKLYFSPWNFSFRNVCSDKEANELLMNNPRLIFQTRGENIVSKFCENLKVKYELKNVGYSEVFRDSVNQFVYEVNYSKSD